MDVEELSMIGPVVDLTSVDAIHRKRITAFVNHFVTQTASFLNRFARAAESKLFDVDSRLQKLEAALILLESKLNSIPELNVSVTKETPLPINDTHNEPQLNVGNEPTGTVSENNQDIESRQEVEKPELDESLRKFVKMLQFGVPVPAVKLKMQQEGVSLENQNKVLGP